MLLSMAMGAATGALTFIGGKIVKTVQSAQSKRLDKKSATDYQYLDNSDDTIKQIENKLSSGDGIYELMDKYPEKADVWKEQLDEIQRIMNDSDPDQPVHSLRSATNKMSKLKGDILEFATKDALENAGLTVETHQMNISGQTGITRPDVIAYNKTNKAIDIFGTTIAPGETVFVECKCGQNSYLTNQLKTHLPNQLSGHGSGRSFLLTTSNINQVDECLVIKTLNDSKTTLVAMDISVEDIEDVIKNYTGGNTQ